MTFWRGINFYYKNWFLNQYNHQVYLKTAEEIKNTYKACRLTSFIFEKILEKDLKPGVSEKEIEQKIYEYAQHYGADKKMAFKTIIGSGKNSSFIHSIPSKRIFKEGDVIQFDLGVRYRNMCSDLSRVVYLGKKKDVPSKLFKRYVLVKKAYEIAVNKIEKGESSILKIAQAVDDFYLENGVIYNFQHSLGHGVGRDIHEYPSLRADLEQDVKLSPGMIFTIEPGLYFPGKYGFRIEDTFYFGDYGLVSLTKATKKFFINY